MTHTSDVYVIKTRYKYEAESTVEDSTNPCTFRKQNAPKASSFKKKSTLHFRKVHSLNQKVQTWNFKS